MALERLFRYIYSARYPIEIPDNDKDLNVAYWMDTLELAIVADKYCLPTLSQLVADHLEGLASERAPDLEDEQKLALFKLLATSGFGSKATDSFVLKLCWTIQTFRNCLMDEHFRILLGQRLALRDKLCSEHTVEALDVPEFRSLLRSDDSLAMKCLKNTMKDLDGWENDDGDAAVKCLDSLCYLQGWYDKKEWSQLQSQ